MTHFIITVEVPDDTPATAEPPRCPKCRCTRYVDYPCHDGSSRVCEVRFHMGIQPVVLQADRRPAASVRAF